MEKLPFRRIYTWLAGLWVVLIVTGCGAKMYRTGSADCRFRLTKPAQMLIGKEWAETSIEARRIEKDSAYKDITHQFMPSDLDDLMVFHKDGTYAFDEGKTKARPGSAQIYESGNWCICQAGEKLILSSGPSVTTYEIVALEEKLLVLQLLRTGNEKADVYLLRYEVAGID